MTPEHLPGFNIAVNVVTVIAVVIGFLVIFQSMYTAVLERTREIGILKSMGASKLRLWAWCCASARCWPWPAWCWALPAPLACGAVFRISFPRSTSRSPAMWIWRGAAIAFAGRFVRGALSRVDGRPQGSHRRAGVRINREQGNQKDRNQMIQAAFEGKRWRVISILWQALAPQEKVPEKYLP